MNLVLICGEHWASRQKGWVTSLPGPVADYYTTSIKLLPFFELSILFLVKNGLAVVIPKALPSAVLPSKIPQFWGLQPCPSRSSPRTGP